MLLQFTPANKSRYEKGYDKLAQLPLGFLVELFKTVKEEKKYKLVRFLKQILQINFSILKYERKKKYNRYSC